MDTRFWGPSGWRLLHLITFTYSPTAEQKKAVKDFFLLLPYVLPCKFCRASLTDYMATEPLELAMESKEKLSRWLYRVHNLVNEKLRGQGLLSEPNPSFEAVQKVYTERIKAGCVRTAFEGWDFLFSIAENHPFSRGAASSTPMPDMPAEISTSKDDSVRNRWNILSPAARMPYYTRWWRVIGDVLPFEEWRNSWTGCKPKYGRIKDRVKWKRELWRLRCCLEQKLELVNRERYDSVCRRLSEHKSGCNKTRRARTCRRITKKNK